MLDVFTPGVASAASGAKAAAANKGFITHFRGRRLGF
jgi:hypothetical protein